MDADLFVDTQPVAPRPARLARVRAALSRWCPSCWLGTLKARLAIGIVAGLLVGMSVTAWQLTARAERDLLQQALQREQLEAARAAAVVGRRLAEMQRSLAQVGALIDPAMRDDPDRLRQLLSGQPLLRAQFSTVFATDAAGHPLAVVATAGDAAAGASLPDRTDLGQALRERRAVVVRGTAGAGAGGLQVVLSGPVGVGDDRAVVIGGVLRLGGDDLLDALGLRAGTPRAAAADDEALIVLTDADGRILSHPARDHRLLTLADEPRLARAYRRWRDDGVLAPDQPAFAGGAADVVAMAREPATGWRVWRAAPHSHFLAALRDARALALRDAALLAAAIGALLVGFLAWQLRALAQLERRAAALLRGEDGGDWPQAQGEIGRLSRTLRHVWAERTQVEAFNAEVLRKLGSVMAAAPVGLAFTRGRRFELVSDELCRLLGCPEHELVGRPMRSVLPSDEDHDALGRAVADAFACGRPYGGEWPLVRADGTRFWGLLRARPVVGGDDDAGTIWSVTDVSEQVAARRELEHAAHHDALTGVVNRQGFDKALQTTFDGQPGSRPASLVMIDLDHFKPINDTAGHAAGDAVLVAVAQAIASRVRGTDVVVRLGGDEFALLLPRCDHERAMAVAAKVRQAIADLSLPWDGHTLRVGASLGVAELAAHHENPAQWLAQADAACYAAKRAGRGTVRAAPASAGASASAPTDAPAPVSAAVPAPADVSDPAPAEC